MRGRVRDLDPQVVAQPDDADADQIGEVRQVPESLRQAELRALGAEAEPTQAVDERLAVHGVRAGPSPARSRALGIAQ